MRYLLCALTDCISPAIARSFPYFVRVDDPMFYTKISLVVLVFCSYLSCQNALCGNAKLPISKTCESLCHGRYIQFADPVCIINEWLPHRTGILIIQFSNRYVWSPLFWFWWTFAFECFYFHRTVPLLRVVYYYYARLAAAHAFARGHIFCMYDLGCRRAYTAIPYLFRRTERPDVSQKRMMRK